MPVVCCSTNDNYENNLGLYPGALLYNWIVSLMIALWFVMHIPAAAVLLCFEQHAAHRVLTQLCTPTAGGNVSIPKKHPESAADGQPGQRGLSDEWGF